jgi:hypothetical protein
LFYSVSVLTRCLIETLIKIRGILALWLCLVLLVALFGREMLAYAARFENVDGEMEVAQDYHHGHPPSIHFEDLGSALMAAFNIFYNEEWHIVMLQFARVTNVSFVYYVIFIIFGQVFFIRLLSAIFLNEFCIQLSSIEQSVKPIQLQKHFNALVLYIKTALFVSSIVYHEVEESSR